MENIKKNLKVTSIAILALAAVSLIMSIADLAITGLQVPEEYLTDGITEGVARIAVVIAWVVGIIVILPSVYIGMKGLKIAKNPDNSKGHIVWAIIMIILNAISTIVALTSLTSAESIASGILGLISPIAHIVLYAIFLRESKQIIKNL